jgi:hypothetical protein
MIFTEKNPPSAEDFEAQFTKFERQKHNNAPIFVHYEYGVGDKVKDYAACINSIDRVFGDIGNTTFTVKKMEEDAIGRIIILEWLNPNFRRLVR